MTITRDMIDIKKLVDEIHAAEAALREDRWLEYFATRPPFGFVRSDQKWSELVLKMYRDWRYVDYVTGLYTLRAWTRGKLHRQNPPAEIRDFNRTMEEQGRPERKEWGAEERNSTIAEEFSQRFLVEMSETG